MLKLAINTTAFDGSDVFWPWLMWLLGAFILGLILGWLLKQLFGCGETDSTPIVAIDAVKDDLTEVEGIGPKIKGLNERPRSRASRYRLNQTNLVDPYDNSCTLLNHPLVC